MTHDYDKLLQTAIDALNSRLGYSFSMDNVILRLFTAKNGKKVYDALVAEYGFSGEDVTEECFRTIIGEAFAYGKRRDDEISGILLREDLNLSDHEVFHLKSKKAELKALAKAKLEAEKAAAAKKAEEDKQKLLAAVEKSGKSIEEILELLK